MLVEQRLRLPISSRKYGQGKLSEEKGQVPVPQASSCAAAAVQGRLLVLELSLDLSCPQGKLIEERLMLLTLAFT